MTGESRWASPVCVVLTSCVNQFSERWKLWESLHSQWIFLFTFSSHHCIIFIYFVLLGKKVTFSNNSQNDVMKKNVKNMIKLKSNKTEPCSIITFHPSFYIWYFDTLPIILKYFELSLVLKAGLLFIVFSQGIIVVLYLSVWVWVLLPPLVKMTSTSICASLFKYWLVHRFSTRGSCSLRLPFVCRDSPDPGLF